jgi:hypothetical protein
MLNNFIGVVMKKSINKNILRFFIAVIIVLICFLTSKTSMATPDPEAFTVIRDCANGVCIVYVYNSNGSLVNIYEELDSH